MYDSTTKPGLPTVEQVTRQEELYPYRRGTLYLIRDEHGIRIVVLGVVAGEVVMHGDGPWPTEDAVCTPLDQQGNPLGLVEERDKYMAEAASLRFELNEPTTKNFVQAVMQEAAHQRQRWGTEHDAGKTPEDWFWLLGYLGGKALRADGVDKRMHRIIATAAACANWYLNARGQDDRMRPGTDAHEDDGGDDEQ